MTTGIKVGDEATNWIIHRSEKQTIESALPHMYTHPHPHFWQVSKSSVTSTRINISVPLNFLSSANRIRGSNPPRNPESPRADGSFWASRLDFFVDVGKLCPVPCLPRFLLASSLTRSPRRSFPSADSRSDRERLVGWSESRRMGVSVDVERRCGRVTSPRISY